MKSQIFWWGSTGISHLHGLRNPGWEGSGPSAPPGQPLSIPPLLPAFLAASVMHPWHSPGKTLLQTPRPRWQSGEKGPEEPEQISHVEMQRCRGEMGQGRLCSCMARIHFLPRELLKVLHRGTNNFRQRNPSRFALAGRGAEQEPRRWVPPLPQPSGKLL